MDSSPVRPSDVPIEPERLRRKRIFIWVGAVLAVLVLTGVIVVAHAGSKKPADLFPTFVDENTVYCSEALTAYDVDDRHDVVQVYVWFNGPGLLEVSVTSGHGTHTSQEYRQGVLNPGEYQHLFDLTGIAWSRTTEVELTVVSPQGGGRCEVQSARAP